MSIRTILVGTTDDNEAMLYDLGFVDFDELIDKHDVADSWCLVGKEIGEFIEHDDLKGLRYLVDFEFIFCIGY